MLRTSADLTWVNIAQCSVGKILKPPETGRAAWPRGRSVNANMCTTRRRRGDPLDCQRRRCVMRMIKRESPSLFPMLSDDFAGMMGLRPWRWLNDMEDESAVLSWSPQIDNKEEATSYLVHDDKNGRETC